MSKRTRQFYTIDFNLSNKVTYADDKEGSRYHGAIAAIQVPDASDLDVKLRVKFDEGDELVLRPGNTFNFDEVRQGANFSWEGQTGKTVVIQISVKGPLQAMPTAGNGNFKQDSYSNFNKYLKPVGNSHSLQLDVNENRSIAHIRNISGHDVYFGSLDDFTSGDYQKNCEVLRDGDVYPHPCKAGVYFRTVSGSNSEGLRITEFLK